MVQGIEDLRTPLRDIINFDKELRGTLSGFMMPAFVIDLPGGGGKRLVSTHETYNEETGVATYRAPGLPGVKGQMTYTYYDPKSVSDTELAEFRLQQESALHRGETMEQFVATVPPKAIPEVLFPVEVSQPPALKQRPKIAPKSDSTMLWETELLKSNPLPHTPSIPEAMHPHL